MTSTYTFKMGMFLDECGLPLDQAAELAQELGAGYAEFFVSHEELTEEVRGPLPARCWTPPASRSTPAAPPPIRSS